MKLGFKSIASLDNNTIEAESCSLIYRHALQVLLAQYDWSFSIMEKRYEVQEPDTNPDLSVKDYTYEYDLPADFLRLVRVYNGLYYRLVSEYNKKPPYLISGGKIYSYLNGIIIKYVYDIQDPNLFTPLFTECLITDIAIRLCKTLNDSVTMLQSLQQEYAYSLSKAKSVDCSQNIIDGTNYGPILLASLTEF